METGSRLRPRQAAGRAMNLYVPTADQLIWARAKEQAATLNVSLSSLVTEALAEYLGAEPEEQEVAERGHE